MAISKESTSRLLFRVGLAVTAIDKFVCSDYDITVVGFGSRNFVVFYICS